MIGQQTATKKYKTTLCRHFNNGNCTLSNNCHYAHGSQELRQITDPVPENVQSLDLSYLKQQGLANNFKTVMCKYFQQSGQCKNGLNCSFAHGPQEMRLTQFQPQMNKPQQQQQYYQQPNMYDPYQSMMMNQMMYNPQQQQPQQMMYNPQQQMYYQQQNVMGGLGGFGQGGGNMMQIDPNQSQIYMMRYIVSQLLILFGGNQQIQFQLKQADQLLNMNDQQKCTQIIQDIMNNPVRTPQEQQKYSEIWQQAQMQYQQQSYQQQYQPSNQFMMPQQNYPLQQQFIPQQMMQQQPLPVKPQSDQNMQNQQENLGQMDLTGSNQQK